MGRIMNDDLAHQGWVIDVLGEWLNLSGDFGMEYLVAKAGKVGAPTLHHSLFLFDCIYPKVHGTGVSCIAWFIYNLSDRPDRIDLQC